jgi:hypothetical protein
MSTAVQEDESITNQLAAPPFSGPVTIPVTVVGNLTSPDSFRLDIPTEFLYVSVIENYHNTITWELVPQTGIDAFFDTPAIDFPGQDTGSTLVEKTRSKVILQWMNVSPERRGRSYYYTLHVVVNAGGILIPVNHDPTVHNEPPT